MTLPPRLREQGGMDREAVEGELLARLKNAVRAEIRALGEIAKNEQYVRTARTRQQDLAGMIEGLRVPLDDEAKRLNEQVATLRARQ